MAGAADMLDEEVTRYFDMNAGAITGHAVRINRPAVPDRLQCLDGSINNSAGLLAIARGNKADTASIMFHLGRIDAGCGQLCLV